MIDAVSAEGCLTLTINRPDKANALTEAMLSQLADAVMHSQDRVLVMTGEGKVFSAGADLDAAKAQLASYNKWMSASTIFQKRNAWEEMLKTYADQVFTIGTVNNSRQPVVVSKYLKNVPEEAIYSWEPTSYFGIYKPDTFWYSPK